MFREANIFSSFSVDNRDKAKDFYGKLLGLSITEIPEMKSIFKIILKDKHEIIVYSKPDHIPAAFTIMNIIVNDVEKTVDMLTEKGIKFEIYNNEQIKTDSRGIFRGEGPVIAWFKDPAGNILSVLEEKQ